MKSDIQFLPLNIPEDNLDSAVVSKLNSSGGASSPDIVVVTDLASLQAVGVGKIASIQAAINTGATNITMAANTIIQFNGGSLTGTGIITGNLTDIRGDVINASYIADTYTIAGTWKVTNISFHWFGIKSDATSVKYDNRNSIKNALYVAASSGHCDLNWYNDEPNSEWFVSALDYGMTGGYDDNINMGLYNTTHVNIKGHNFPKLHALDNNTVPVGHGLRSTIFQLFEAKYCTISGFELIGDRQTATYLPEHKMGIVVSNNSNYSEVFGNDIHDFSGDAIIFEYQFYTGYPDSATLTRANWSTGDINSTTGVLDSGATEYMTTTNFLDISTSLFQDRGWFYVIGKMDVENYFVSFYDAGGAFIGKSKVLEPYNRVYFPTTARQVKITMWYQTDLDLARPIRFNSYDYPIGVVIRDNQLHHCSRQGISNVSHYTKILGNTISYIFGQSAGPCAGIDLEDGTYFIYNVEIRNNVFLNNSGFHVLLKYNRNIVVEDNWFMDKDWIDDGVYTYYGDFSGGLAASYVSGLIATNNHFITRKVEIGRDAKFSNNYLKNTTLSLESGSADCYNNFGVNVKIASSSEVYPFNGRPQFYNNNFVWDRKVEWDVASYAFSVRGRYDERNNVYDFKGKNEGTGNVLVWRNGATTADSGTGYLDGMRIYGYTGSNTKGFGGYGLVDITNSEFSCGYWNYDTNTTPRDIAIKNTKFKQYIFEDLLTYNDTNLPTVADYKTITYDNVTVTYDDTGFTNSLIDIQNHNANYIFKNCTFIANAAVTNARFIDVDNKGTVVFENCTFTAISAEVYDFADSLSSKAYVRNCYFKNVTFTPRVGDVFEYNTTL